MSDFLYPDWPAPSRVRAVSTTRTGGFGGGPYAGLNLAGHVGDDPAIVAANRRWLRETLQLPTEPAWIEQVHGIAAQQLPAPPGCVADAAWTTRPGEVCVVMTADCLPVLFCDEAGSCVAVAHAGWRGLADGVLETLVASLPVPADRLLAWMGPAIGPSAFEVGAEVRERFLADDAAAAPHFVAGNAANKYQADLFGLARLRLQRIGLSRISGGGICTFEDPQRFFSFRRDAVCGRMASLIWMDAGTA